MSDQPHEHDHDHELEELTFEHLRFDLQDGVAVITIDRQEALNALDQDVLAELALAFDVAETDAEVRALVVTGAGRAFVAGADIAELQRLSDAFAGREAALMGQEVMNSLAAMPFPTIAAVNGFALGGGLELALACHIRLASENAKFGLPEVKLGIIPGYGGTVRLPRLVGKGRALEMILTGDMIDAQEAHRIGLVNRVVPQAELLDAARELASKIMANGPVAVALALEAVENGLTATVEEAQRFESNLFGLLASTSDMREGMGAFLEKRKANFTGK